MPATGKWRIVEGIPPLEAYQHLRRSAGWYCTDDEATATGLENSLYSLVAEIDSKIIGCARLVGDGQLYFYLQDVIVLPPYQGRGIAKALTARLMQYLEEKAPPNSFIGLMAAKGVAGFYEKFGFSKRDEEAPGMYRVHKIERK